MPLRMVQPIDGTAAFLEDEKGRKLYFPDPKLSGSLKAGEVLVADGFGGSMVYGCNVEEITLSTSGATTDSTANLLPAGAEIMAVCARITVAITTATNWALGDATAAARFAAANSTLTVGTTSIGMAHRQPDAANAAAGPVQAAAAKLRVTTTGTPGAGKIRVAVYYRKYVAPTA